MLKKNFKVLKTNKEITGLELLEYIHHKTILMACNKLQIKDVIKNYKNQNYTRSLFLLNLSKFVQYNLQFHDVKIQGDNNIYKFNNLFYELHYQNMQGIFSMISLDNFNVSIYNIDLKKAVDKNPNQSRYISIRDLIFIPRELTDIEKEYLKFQYCDIPFDLRNLIEYTIDDYQLTDNSKITESNKKLIKEGKLPIHYGDDNKPIKIVKKNRRAAVAAIP